MATLKITEQNKLNVLDFKQDTFELNGVNTDSLELLFNATDSVVDLALKDMNKNEKAVLIISDDKLIDLCDYIYVRVTKTMLKGVVSYSYLLVKDNTTDVVIKELKEELQEQKAKNFYYEILLGVNN